MNVELDNDNIMTDCPVCNKHFLKENIETHVNKCLFLNTTNGNTAGGPIVKTKRSYDMFEKSSPPSSANAKKIKFDTSKKLINRNRNVVIAETSIELSDDDDKEKNPNQSVEMVKKKQILLLFSLKFNIFF